MRKVIVLLIATLSLSLVACNTKEVSAEFFGNTVVINNSKNSELVSLIDNEVSDYKSTLKNVTESEFVVKINGQVVEDYKNYDDDIDTIKVDVYEYVAVVEEEKVGFDTAKIEDFSIAKGNEEVEVEGVDGLLVKNVLKLYINGEFEEVVTEEIDTELSYDPVNEVIRVGMMEIDSENPKYTKESCEVELARRVEEDSAEGITVQYLCIPVENSDEYQIQIIQ